MPGSILTAAGSPVIRVLVLCQALVGRALVLDGLKAVEEGASDHGFLSHLLGDSEGSAGGTGSERLPATKASSMT